MGGEVGEGVLFRKKPIREKLAKLISVWEEGIYLGHMAISGESAIGAAEGIRKTRRMQSRPIMQRWGPENAKVGGVPWRVSQDDPEADGPMPKPCNPYFPGGE